MSALSNLDDDGEWPSLANAEKQIAAAKAQQKKARKKGKLDRVNKRTQKRKDEKKKEERQRQPSLMEYFTTASTNGRAAACAPGGMTLEEQAERRVATVLQSLAPEQSVAVLDDSDLILVEAGPGAGKTTVITTLAVVLILNHSIKAEMMLICSFTRNASSELEERGKVAIGGLAGKFGLPTYGTLHATARGLLQQWGLPTTVGSPQQKFDAVRAALHTLRARRIPVVQKAALELVAAARGRLDARGPSRPFDIALIHEFDNEMKLRDVMDMDSFIPTAVHMLLERGTPPFSIVIVDEVQDLSRMQIQFVLLLARRRFCVGDANQSIFSFCTGLFDPLRTLRVQDGVSIRTLRNNYRSFEGIVGLADDVLGRRERDGNRQAAARGRAPRGFESCPSEIWPLDNERAEAECAAGLAASHAEEHPYRSFAVLYRTNRQHGEVARAMAAAKIPIGGGHGITLSTIHAAKGLEWDVVVVIGLSETIFPCRLWRGLDTTERALAKAEEMRLLYIAISRASNSLFLLRPLRRGNVRMPGDFSAPLEASEVLIRALRTSNARKAQARKARRRPAEGPAEGHDLPRPKKKSTR